MNWTQRRFLAISLCAIAQAASDLPPVVAVVNGRKITRRDLERRVAQSRSMDPEGFDRMSESVRQRALARVLRACIVRELEYQEALRRGVRVRDERVRLALDTARRRYPSQDAFRRSLLQGQITVGQWRQEMKRTLMISGLEERISAGLPAPEWAKQRPLWLQGLRNRARIWVWEP